jgi:micrococcal nuclease
MDRQPRRFRTFATAAILGLVTTTTLVAAPADAAVSGTAYRVKGVIDGDTIKVVIGSRTEHIRLIGINTPEMSTNECHARQATSAMQSLVQSKHVYLKGDKTQGNRDKYGRLLRYVYTAQGKRDVAKSLIAGGHGREFTYNKPYHHRKAYIAAEKKASKAKKGLWKSCVKTASKGKCLIKGNISSSGSKIYHVPGQDYYDVTQITTAKGERWFCTEAEAKAAGWRRSFS